ncbi:hypothetical protein RHMOL_Rhmol06G0060500 [Rhododendron molle]|uniref:Uncharacterized protein n=1 Tax=Rhododendron molle TaxID=49168 RepID=A0ACC0N995_RHOML|nr:hypothetical protein RHMOL_Rhmol06G0060500 [Rhododendron molle]
MENQLHQRNRDKLDQDQHRSTECKSTPPPQPPSSAASPPSASSSPAHEFSFTISLHHHHQPPSSAAKPPPPSIAVDLSPADEIFFHGHLLPLHLLSHLPHPSSPRSSANSLDSFTLPINENPQIPTSTATNPDPINENKRPKQKPKPKSKSFSLFGIPIRRKADFTEERETEEEEREKQRKKLKFDLSHVLKRYMRMVRPLFHRRRESDVQLRRQPHSFSGYLSPRDYYEEEQVRGRRWGEFSAPASMKTSPYNSGPLVGNGVVSTSDSTMEELQAAIQAAIAHCKNSIAMEDKINKC